MDPYVYPGTDVLQNLRDLRNPVELREYETDATKLRIAQLKNKLIPGILDAAHLRAIHRHIFQDVYGWAGNFRTVEIGFAFVPYIESSLAQLAAELRKEHYLAGMELPQFAKRASYHLGQLNAIHPFREGNGRAQNEFLRHLAHRNKMNLSWSGITHDQLYEAARRSYRQGDNSGFERILLEAHTG